jgi:hypothetical protein
MGLPTDASLFSPNIRSGESLLVLPQAHEGADRILYQGDPRGPRHIERRNDEAAAQ